MKRSYELIWMTVGCFGWVSSSVLTADNAITVAFGFLSIVACFATLVLEFSKPK